MVPNIAIKAPSLACNCVLWARWYLGGREDIRGVAGNIEPTSPTPYVGGIVITREGPKGHVAVIIKIENGFLYLKEANYVNCKVTEDRKLAIDSPLIIGYR